MATLSNRRAKSNAFAYTLGALMEREFHRISTETKPTAPFTLRRASFKGEGLQAGAHGACQGRLI